MHFSTAIAAASAVIPLVSAHGNAPVPQIIGLNPRDLKARDLLSSAGARFASVRDFAKAPSLANNSPADLKARQTGQCGAGIGSCPAGQCCSQSGYCGTTADFCYSPGCNYQYGPGCPENVTPSGTNTSTIARTKVGSVAYGGGGIYNCVTPGTVALTYDDGPLQTLTAHILDVLASYNAKATFFITGNNINKGQIDTTTEFVNVIKRMDSEGHQIASHTWTHLDLSAISQADRLNQMYKLEMALRNIVGKIPTYMRPPYSSCTGQCETDMANLGYHVTYFDVDTDDYNQDDVNKIQNSKNWFKGNITANGATATTAKWLEIAHDIHVQTANNLTDYMLSTLTQLGYKAVTVGECLGDPAANWYRTAGGAGTSTTTAGSGTGSSTAPAATGTKKVSTDATCGGTNGYTCQGSTFGNCCSQYGWCGSSTDHCGTSCQTAFGTCTNGAAGTTSAAAPATSSKPTSTIKPTSTSKPASSAASVSTRASSSSSARASSSTRPVSSSVKTSSTKTSSAAASSTKVSSDGTCGTTQGVCQGSAFGNCCSQYGWCGTTTGHCGTGCQKAFGTCT